MSLAKWIIKNGPGSPGQTAKVWTKQYLKFPKETPRNEIFEQIVYAFQSGQLSVGNLQYETEVSSIVSHSQDCLASLIFAMSCDIKGFVKNTTFSIDNFNLVTEVIYETVRKLAPNAINSSLDEFKSNAKWYLTGKKLLG